MGKKKGYSENSTKNSIYDDFLEKYGNSMNFNDARPLLEKEGITPSKEIYSSRVWHHMINKGRIGQKQ